MPQADIEAQPLVDYNLGAANGATLFCSRTDLQVDKKSAITYYRAVL